MKIELMKKEISMKKKIATLLSAMVMSAYVNAGQADAPVDITFNVEEGCEAVWAGGDAVNFGDITPYTTAANLPTVTKYLNIQCSNGLGYQIENTTQSEFTGIARVVMLDPENGDADISVAPIAGIGNLAPQQPAIKVKMVRPDGTDFNPTEKPFADAAPGQLSTAAPSVVTITW